MIGEGKNMYELVSDGGYDVKHAQTTSDGTPIGPNMVIRCYNLVNYNSKCHLGALPANVLAGYPTMTKFITELSSKVLPSDKRAVWFHEVNFDLGGGRGTTGIFEGRIATGEINLVWLNSLEIKLKQVLKATAQMNKEGMLEIEDPKDPTKTVKLCLFYSCICSNLSYNEARDLFGQSMVTVPPGLQEIKQEHLDDKYGLVPAYRAKISFYMVHEDGTFTRIEDVDKKEDGIFGDFFNQPVEDAKKRVQKLH